MVVALRLGENDLRGELGGVLDTLPWLQQLDVQGNGLRGPLPQPAAGRQLQLLSSDVKDAPVARDAPCACSRLCSSEAMRAPHARGGGLMGWSKPLSFDAWRGTQAQPHSQRLRL